MSLILLVTLVRFHQEHYRHLREKIEGVKKYCSAKKLYKTCPYTGEYKYLVLVSDTVQKLGCKSVSSFALFVSVCYKQAYLGILF